MNHECIFLLFLYKIFAFLIFKRASSSQHSSLITWIEWCISLPSINFLHFSFSPLYFSLIVSRSCAIIPPAFFYLFSFHVSLFILFSFYVVSDVHRVTSKMIFILGWKKKKIKEWINGEATHRIAVKAMDASEMRENVLRNELKIYVYKFIPRFYSKKWSEWRYECL